MTEKQKKTHRQLQKEETKRIILDSAYHLFGEKGYAKTTMRLIAKEAGVGLGTICKHFPDKPSLLVAAFQEDLSQIIQNSFHSLPEKGIISQLLHLVNDIYGFYAQSPRVSRALLKEIMFLEGDYGKALNNQVYGLLAEIQTLIQKAIENNELKPETDAQAGILAFWSFYFMVLIMGLNEPVFDKNRQLGILEVLLKQYFDC